MRCTPHTFRHQAITWLTRHSGMADAELQLIWGHARRETLAVYQHVALDGDLEKKYQDSMKEGRTVIVADTTATVISGADRSRSDWVADCRGFPASQRLLHREQRCPAVHSDIHGLRLPIAERENECVGGVIKVYRGQI